MYISRPNSHSCRTTHPNAEGVSDREYNLIRVRVSDRDYSRTLVQTHQIAGGQRLWARIRAMIEVIGRL